MRNREAEKMDRLVELVLRHTPLYYKMKEQLAIEAWEEVVGKMINSRTRRIWVKDGVLYLAFTSSVVRNEIAMIKESLIIKLNKKVGLNVIKDMVFVK